MNALIWLVVIALGMGVVGLFAFLWSMRSGQLEDLDGAAVRVLLDADDRPLRSPADPVGIASHSAAERVMDPRRSTDVKTRDTSNAEDI